MCRVVSQSFRRGPRAAAHSRRLLRQSLERWGLADLSRTAELLTSELVTNALVHAHSPVRLVVAVADGTVEVGVTDWNPHKPPLKPRRGLLLVRELAHDWGTVDVTAGKQVWFSMQADSWPYRTACVCHGEDLERVRLGSGRLAAAMPEPWVLPEDVRAPR
jgi:histidine kinase-like protein